MQSDLDIPYIFPDMSRSTTAHIFPMVRWSSVVPKPHFCLTEEHLQAAPAESFQKITISLGSKPFRQQIGVHDNVGQDNVSRNPIQQTNCMKLSPIWEATSRLRVLNNFPTFCGNRRFITVFRRAPILSKINPVHTTPSYFYKIHFNIILPPMSRSSSWSRFFWLSHQNPVCIPLLPHTCHKPCQSHSH
jgi:hypothetical protein